MSVDSIYSATLGEYFLCPDLDGYWRKFRASRYMCRRLIIIDLHSLASSFLDPTTPPIQLIFAWNCVAITSFFSSFLSSWLMMTHDDTIWYLTYPTYHDITWPMMTNPRRPHRKGHHGLGWSKWSLAFLPLLSCQDLSRSVKAWRDRAPTNSLSAWWL